MITVMRRKTVLTVVVRLRRSREKRKLTVTVIGVLISFQPTVECLGDFRFLMKAKQSVVCFEIFLHYYFIQKYLTPGPNVKDYF